MKMVDMGRAKPKGKEDAATESMAWSGEAEGPRVHLDPERVKKMFGAPPAPGSEHHIQGHARVVGSREEQTPVTEDRGGPVHSIEIVIHHMGMEPKSVSDDGKSVRDNVEEAAESVEKRDAGTVRTGKKIAEKPEGKAGGKW